MLHVGEDPERVALSTRLDRSYDALMATTSRHFGSSGAGWALSGVAGLDTPTMNRLLLRDASPVDAGAILERAALFFRERQVPWSAILSAGVRADWHGELLARGFTTASTLDVLVRPPARLPEDRPGITVREAREDELPLFTELLIEVFHMPRRFYPALHDMSEVWRDRLGAKLYFAHDESGEPAATALLVEHEGVAGIYNVGTRRHARRQGLARALMEHAFEDALGADVVTLQVTPASVAEAFYLRLGFERLHAWRFYAPGPKLASFITRW